MILIEKVDFPDNMTTEDKESILIEREGYHQTQLKTLVRYGGLNVLDSRYIATSGC